MTLLKIFNPFSKKLILITSQVLIIVNSYKNYFIVLPFTFNNFYVKFLAFDRLNFFLYNSRLFSITIII